MPTNPLGSHHFDEPDLTLNYFYFNKGDTHCQFYLQSQKYKRIRAKLGGLSSLTLTANIISKTSYVRANKGRKNPISITCKDYEFD